MISRNRTHRGTGTLRLAPAATRPTMTGKARPRRRSISGRREPISISASDPSLPPTLSLTAGHSDTFSRFLGINGFDPATGINCANSATTPACRFLLVGTSAAVSYPESVSRQHEVVAIFKYKLTRNLMPKLEFRYQQFDNKDFQTSPMTQYQGCGSASAASTVTGCPVQVVSSTTSATPTLSPNGQISFYPYFQVVDPSAARYLFLGVDPPVV